MFFLVVRSQITQTSSITTTTKHNTTDKSTTTTTTDKPTNIDTTTIDMAKYVVKQRDALRGIASKTPIKLNNAFAVLQTTDEDSDDDDDDTTGHEMKNSKATGAKAKQKQK